MNTIENLGPVRSVKPELVFEIAFEGIRERKRHKSGVALLFPRILCWREDKPTNEASTKADLLSMLQLRCITFLAVGQKTQQRQQPLLGFFTNNHQIGA